MEAHTAPQPIKLCCGTDFFMTVDKDKWRGGGVEMDSMTQGLVGF